MNGCPSHDGIENTFSNIYVLLKSDGQAIPMCVLNL